MEIVKPHYKISKPVKNWKEIKGQAEEMLKMFAPDYNWKGYYNKAFVIAHSEVTETPYSFFVVSPEVVNEGMFEKQIIINPVITSALEVVDKEGIQIPNTKVYDEPCLQFAFRRPKPVKRYLEIAVHYQTVNWLGRLKDNVVTLNGIASQIFQHAVEHIEGSNIFFKRETPVKWWELLGKDKPVCGDSLDMFDPTGLTPAKEQAQNLGG